MKIKSYRYASAWLAALAIAVTSQQIRAADFHVASAQDLQSALTVAAHNGTDNNIYLTNGYYGGNFDYNSFNANNLSLLAEPGVTNTAIIIDGGGVGFALRLSNSASVSSITVQGISFAIDNPGNGNVDALRIGAGSLATVSLSGCVFFANTGTRAGLGWNIASGLNAIVNGCTVVGGTGAAFSGPTGNIIVQNCAFSAVNGNGLEISSGASIAISNSTFNGNLGPGLRVESTGATVNISQNIFIGNGVVYGGATEIWNAGAVTLAGNAFTNNAGGASAFLKGINSVTLTGNTFIGNSGNGFLATGNGGGVDIEDNTGQSQTWTNIDTTITGNMFISNSASFGGAIYVNVEAATNVTILANTLEQNTAADGGGAVYVSAPTVTVSDNTLEQNTAGGSGGAVYVSAPTVTISDNVLGGNSQTNATSSGGGVWVNASSNLFFINNTITANASAGGGGGVAFQVNGLVEVLNVFNNIIWGNSGGPGADVWMAGTGSERVFSNNDANDIFGVWDLFENNLNIDPQFVAASLGDYHLKQTSPCHNAGTIAGLSLPVLDLDGNPRIVANMIDMGCYQLGASLPALQIQPTATNSFMLQWSSAAGATYALEVSTNLLQGFQVLIPSIQATPPSNQISPPAVQGAASAFYRLRVL